MSKLERRVNMSFEKHFKTLRKWFYLETALWVFIAAFLISSVIYFPSGTLLYLAIALVLAVLEFFVVRKVQKLKEVSDFSEIPDESVFEKYFDRYGRRLANWILIAFLQVFGFAMAIISLGVNSKLYEVLETYTKDQFIFELTAFFLIKNIFIVKWLLSKHEYSNKQKLIKTIRGSIIGSAIFWAAAIGLFFAFEYVFVLNIYTFITAMYFAVIVILNLTAIRNMAYTKKKYALIVVAAVLVIALFAGGYTFLSRDIWLTQPYINSIPNIYDSKAEITYDDASGIYTITKADGDFKILQLTDIHLGGGVLSYDKEMKALEAVYELLDRTRPDFVIVTGDLVFPVGYASFSFNNTAPVQQFAAFMRNLGIPWAFTYGNHDTESYAATSDHDLNKIGRAHV